MNQTATTRYTAAQIAEWTGGRIAGGHPPAAFAGVYSDTRAPLENGLFFCLKGPNFNANEFTATAFAQGASGAVMDDEAMALQAAMAHPDKTVILVKNTLDAIKSAAKSNLATFNIPVIGVTGSNGKTTVKEMIAGLMSARYSVHKTKGNLNNQIGLPLTLLGLAREHTAAVVELGMNTPGEIPILSDIAAPTAGVITNIGTAHIAEFGSIEAIRNEKGALARYVSPSGKVFLNADDPMTPGIARTVRAQVVTFGIRAMADYRAIDLATNGRIGMKFVMTMPGGRKTNGLHLPLAGLHNMLNAVAALSVAIELGVSPESIAGSLEALKPAGGRMNIVPLSGGVRLIDDTYNANPNSVTAGIETLVSLPGGTGTVAVIGDMLELGGQSERLHREIGRRAAELGVGRLFAFGPASKWIAEEAVAGGLPKDSVEHFTDRDGLAVAVESVLSGGEKILVKGSRGMRLESVVEHLKAKRGLDIA